jgi:mono/diheme cytochrome c family protein
MGASLGPYSIGLFGLISPRILRIVCVAVVGLFLLVGLDPQIAAGQALPNWDPPAIDVFPDHNEFAAGKRPVQELIDMGRKLFRTSFNILDGAGRPNSTGDSKPTIRVTRGLQLFQRIAGPDANSCAGCHNQPIVGGAGDFAANVFVGAHFTDPPATTIDATVTNERNTLSIFGAGAIEMVAREMTIELQNQRDAARLGAASTHGNEKVRLEAKGVGFGYLTVRPDGTYSTEELEGIDSDLIVKPFGVKGVAVSIREFTNFALNQHHGMQSEERFGWARTGVGDFDGDGVENEFTVGQVTALTVYQASLPPPRHVPYSDREQARLSRLGEQRFEDVGCASCHKPFLPLRSAWFFEPSPFNRPGSIVPSDVIGQITIPIPVEPSSGVYITPDGEVRVQAYSDLKRHVICDSEDPFYCNERIRQDFVPTDQFLTTKLWDAGSSAPYGHRGDLTTISEAIIHHAGEAKRARHAFLDLPNQDKRAIIFFLKSLRIDESTDSAKEGGPRR